MRFFIAIILALCFSPTHAGVYSDDVTKCLVSSTSSDDKYDLIRWIFSSAALHPKVAGIATISAEERDDINRSVARIFERLLTATCRSQVKAAIRYEGQLAMQQSFQILGQVAMQELMTHQNVSQGFEGVAKYFDNSKFEELGAK